MKRVCVCVVLLYSVQRKARGVLYLIQSFVSSTKLPYYKQCPSGRPFGKKKSWTDVLRKGKGVECCGRQVGMKPEVRGLKRNES